MSEDYEANLLYQIPLEQLNIDPDQPRKHFDDQALEELRESIKQHGVINPILFRKDSDNKLFIVAGERRFRATESIDNTGTIPAIFIDKPYELVALIENMLRENLTAMEEAIAAKRIVDQNQMSQTNLAAALGNAESTVSELLKLNELPKKIQEKTLTDKRWSRRLLLELAREPDSKKQRAKFISIKKKIETNKPMVGNRTKNKQLDIMINRISLLEKQLTSIFSDSKKWTTDDLELLKMSLEEFQDKMKTLCKAD